MTVLRLGADNAPERPEVDLFGHKYRLRPLTRSVQMALQKADKELAALTDDDDMADHAIAVLAGTFDAMLVADGDEKRKPKTVIMEKWKADELSLPALRTFGDQLEERAVAADRPTSPAPN